MKKFLDGLIGFRKLLFGLIFLIVVTTLLILGYIPNKDWLSNMSSVIIAFFSTNLGERIIDVTKTYLDNKKIEGIVNDAKEKLGL